MSSLVGGLCCKSELAGTLALNPIFKRADILASLKMLDELPKKSFQMDTVYFCTEPNFENSPSSSITY